MRRRPCGFSTKLQHHVSLHVERAETPRRLDRGDRGELARPCVKAEQLPDVDVADAVAVGHAEVGIADIAAHPLEPAPGHRVLARVHQRHAPGLDVLLVHLHRVVPHVERDVRHVQEVIGEVLLDHVALVAAADDELVDAARRIALHDVPEDRLAADLHHRLGANRGLLADAGTEATGEDDGFQLRPPRSVRLSPDLSRVHRAKGWNAGKEVAWSESMRFLKQTVCHQQCIRLGPRACLVRNTPRQPIWSRSPATGQTEKPGIRPIQRRAGR